MLKWTEERVEQLLKLNKEGLSASQIGERMGVSRNTILGRLNRMGVRKNTVGPRGTTRLALPLKPSRKQHSIRSPFMPKPKQTRLPPKPPVEAKSVPAQCAALQVALLDLKENMCRWPIGDPGTDGFHFCGHQKAFGVSYCEHHAEKAFQGYKRRREASPMKDAA